MVDLYAFSLILCLDRMNMIFKRDCGKQISFVCFKASGIMSRLLTEDNTVSFSGVASQSIQAESQDRVLAAHQLQPCQASMSLWMRSPPTMTEALVATPSKSCLLR